MFKTVSFIVLAITFAAIALHFVVYFLRSLMQGKKFCPLCSIIKFPVYLLTLLLLEQKLGFFGRIRKLVYIVTLFCFFVLLYTGFAPPVCMGVNLSGYMLMLHATAAPVFAACVTILVVMWAYSCRFTQQDFLPLLRLFKPETPWKESAKPTIGFMQRVCFWAIAILVLPLILSIVLSMFPLFGTHMQEVLFQIHRYTALTLLVAVIAHFYFAALTANNN